MTRSLVRITAASVIALAVSTATVAQDDQANGAGSADLAKQSQNPVGELISLPFQNNTNFGRPIAAT